MLHDAPFPYGLPVANKLGIPTVSMWVIGPLGSFLTHPAGSPAGVATMPQFNMWYPQPLVRSAISYADAPSFLGTAYSDTHTAMLSQAAPVADALGPKPARAAASGADCCGLCLTALVSCTACQRPCSAPPMHGCAQSFWSRVRNARTWASGLLTMKAWDEAYRPMW